MTDSPSTPSQNPSGLPEKFSFIVSRDEAIAVRDMARRFAPEPKNGYRVHVQFGARKRTWVTPEMNVVAHLSFDDYAEPHRGWLTLNINILEFVHDVCQLDGEVTVEADFQKNTITVHAPTTSTCVKMPRQQQEAFDLTALLSNKISVTPSDIARLGRAIDLYPVPFDYENFPSLFPFLNFVFEGKNLIVKRDWSDYGAGEVSVTIPASGDRPHSFSCFPNVLAREMFFGDQHANEAFTFSFSETTTHYMYVQAGNFGARVELGNETTHKYRQAVEALLGENEIDVVTDHLRGWDAVVQCSLNGVQVSVQICKGENQPDYFRLAATVLDGAPWNLEVASEINCWNSTWSNVKLVRKEPSLLAIREVLATHIDLLPEAVSDLVQKAKVVSEVVGVLI